MAELNIRAATPSDLDAAIPLLALSFPGAQKFSHEFLRWQYYANPVGAPLGCNIDDGTQMLGHLMGIPIEVTLRGEPRLVTLIMNIAVHPAQRGRGLFKTLVETVITLSAARGHAGVIGVANQNSVAAFEQGLGFQNVAGLHAHIECLPHRIAMDSALRHAEFAHRWTSASLTWRLSNPFNPLRVVDQRSDSLIIEGASNWSALRTRAVVPRGDLTWNGEEIVLLRPAVVIGLIPKGSLRPGLRVTIPQRLRPSPLRLIYFDHAPQAVPLDPQRILFNFLDFDAF